MKPQNLSRWAFKKTFNPKPNNSNWLDKTVLNPDRFLNPDIKLCRKVL